MARLARKLVPYYVAFMKKLKAVNESSRETQNDERMGVHTRPRDTPIIKLDDPPHCTAECTNDLRFK